MVFASLEMFKTNRIVAEQEELSSCLGGKQKDLFEWIRLGGWG